MIIVIIIIVDVFVVAIVINNNTIMSIIILLIWEFFIPALADGYLLESEWQQVSSSLQDSP